MAKLNVTTVPEVVRAAATLERAGLSLARAATAEASERDPLNVAYSAASSGRVASSFLSSLQAGN
jgi:hypothetical protein